MICFRNTLSNAAKIIKIVRKTILFFTEMTPIIYISTNTLYKEQIINID